MVDNKTLTASAFAVKAGVSRQAVSKAIKAGLIVRTSDKKIDITDPANKNYLKQKTDYYKKPGSDIVKKSKKVLADKKNGKPVTKKAKPVIKKNESVSNQKKTVKTKAQTKKTSSRKKKPETEVGPEIYDDGEDLLAVDRTDPDNLIGFSKFDLDRLKVISMIQQTDLNTKIKRDQFVSKDIISAIFSRFFEIHMNEFLTVKEKLVPDLSSIYENSDSEKSMEAGDKIDEILWKVLESIKRMANKHLNEIKAEKVGNDSN